MKRTVWMLRILLVGLLPQMGWGESQTSNMTRVLFLGDNALHKPALRHEILEPVLAQRKIELRYTDDVEVLNPATLAGYDALLIYANIEHIEPDQEAALLGYVENGGGLVALHCASFCFLNSPKYIELVGAQFRRHGAGVFSETIVNSNHPVMWGHEAIESWDESYVHAKHNHDRTVLAERRDGRRAEPWTWVREHGKGRVFYTAWGHDERTWSHEGFHDLVERGIRWASANSPNRLKRVEGLTAFSYSESAAPLPNYVPNARWGTQGDPIQTMQDPLSPQESMKHLATFPDFEVELFASEPQIINPLWMAFDHRGRLWIAETVDYPNELQPDGQGRDRLKILEDTNGDGSMDKSTIFADKLSIPTSFVFANGGVIVIHSGRTEFLGDSDGDDVADVREVLFEGWGTGDTHATASNLRYGFDHWIWGVVGYSGFNGTVGGEAIRFGQGIFRFRPDGSELEFVRSSNNNTWGLAFTEDNVVIGSTANGNASMYMPIANRYYEAVNGWSASRLESIADSQRFFPITERVRQVDWHDQYTAGSGSALYTARQFPAVYWNRGQFVNEPTGHITGQFFLRRKGADFIADNARNFLASDDEWTSPVYAEVGPDGALWVVDWYNYIIQHNPTPIGFDTGQGNAYDTPLRDKSHGRIYRVSYSKGRQPTMLNLEGANAIQLVAALKNDNLFWRLHAQRLLIERGQQDVFRRLRDLVKDQELDEIGSNPGALHALWTMKGLGMLEGNHADAREAAQGALRHTAASVRRAALMVLPRDEQSAAAIIYGGLLHDDDALVRKASLLALSEMPSVEGVGNALLSVFDNEENQGERWILDAATSGSAKHDAAFLKAALKGYRADAETGLSSDFEQVMRRVTTHYALRAPVDSIVATLESLQGADVAVATAVLDGLLAGWPAEAAVRLEASDRATLIALMDSLPASVRDRLLGLSLRWNAPNLFGDRIEAIVGSIREVVANPGASDDDRIEAAQRWFAIDDSPAVAVEILEQISLLSSPAQAVGFVNAVGTSRNDEAGRSILSRWQQFTPTVRRAALAVLMRRSSWVEALLDDVEGGAIARTDLGVEHWSQLRRNRSRRISRRAFRLSQANTEVSQDRESIVKELMPWAEKEGNAERGAEIFAANCAVCHVFNGEGGKVGPELTGIGSRDRRDILLEILDPNRSVEANYRLWTVETKDGTSYSGRLEAETRTTIEILDIAAQKHVVQRSEIASLTASPMSIMPVGFEALPGEDLSSLIEFLVQPH